MSEQLLEAARNYAAEPSDERGARLIEAVLNLPFDHPAWKKVQGSSGAITVSSVNLGIYEDIGFIGLRPMQLTDADAQQIITSALGGPSRCTITPQQSPPK